jgi:hypothetical protein
MSVSKLRDVTFWRILLQKSVAPDRCSSIIQPRATGFDLPSLTFSTQPSRYGRQNEFVLGASRTSRPSLRMVASVLGEVISSAEASGQRPTATPRPA